MFTDININSINNKTDPISDKYIFIEKKSKKRSDLEQDPDPRIRIHIKMKRIRNTAFFNVIFFPTAMIFPSPLHNLIFFPKLGRIRNFIDPYLFDMYKCLPAYSAGEHDQFPHHHLLHHCRW